MKDNPSVLRKGPGMNKKLNCRITNTACISEYYNLRFT